jgi:phenylalanyl-tRNA synthetase beta chain
MFCGRNCVQFFDLQAKIVLDTLVCMFSQYCMDKYTAEYCEVVLPDGTATRYPRLSYREEVVNIQKTNQYIGIR